MNPFWNIRIWDMYVDAHYAKVKVDFEKNRGHWTSIAYRRYWAKDGRWYGL